MPSTITIVWSDSLYAAYPYAKKMEYLAKVWDGSKGEVGDNLGFWGCMTVACESGGRDEDNNIFTYASRATTSSCSQFFTYCKMKIATSPLFYRGTTNFTLKKLGNLQRHSRQIPSKFANTVGRFTIHLIVLRQFGDCPLLATSWGQFPPSQGCNEEFSNFYSQ